MEYMEKKEIEPQAYGAKAKVHGEVSTFETFSAAVDAQVIGTSKKNVEAISTRAKLPETILDIQNQIT